MEIEGTYQKYLPYIVEIRKRLFFVVSLFVISGALGFILYERIIRLVLSVFRLEGVNLVFTSPFQFMELAISSGILVGTITVFPLLIIQILGFIRPALKKKEFNMVVRAVPVSVFLFILGFSFGALMMRYVLTLFYDKSASLNIGNFLDISQFLSQIIITSSLMGIGFQFPIVLTILIHLKIIQLKFIVKQRVFAYAAALIFAALMPPTDLLSLVILTIPLIVLYEATIFLNRYVVKSK